jgi:hypothetical protein
MGYNKRVFAPSGPLPKPTVMAYPETRILVELVMSSINQQLDEKYPRDTVKRFGNIQFQ